MTGSKRVLWRTLILSALILPVPPGPLRAQPQGQPADTTQAGSTLAALRDRIEERYQVLPLQNGIVLIPRYGTEDIQSIELAGESIALNGQLVTGAELRQRLGADAEHVTRLSFLDPSTRRVLFGIGATPGLPDTAAAAVIPAAPEDAAEADEPEGADIDIDIDSSEDQVRVGGSIHVEPGETVDGDVVTVGGSARVDGHVTGDVVAVGGSVDLGPSAVVDGDAVAVGGRVNRASGAVVRGEISEVAFGVPPMRWRGRGFDAPAPWSGVSGVIGTVVWIVVLALLTCLALLLARRPISRMEYRVRTSPWKAALVGLAAQILFFPILFLLVFVLAISIIGIPLLLVIPFALLALLIGVLLGFTAVAKAIGHGAENRFGWSHPNDYLSLIVGVGLIMAVSFFASVLHMGGGPLHVFAIILAIVGFILQYVAWTIGFGVLLLTRFGTRYRWGEGEPATPAEPYEPEPPSLQPAPAPPVAP